MTDASSNINVRRRGLLIKNVSKLSMSSIP